MKTLCAGSPGLLEEPGAPPQPASVAASNANAESKKQEMEEQSPFSDSYVEALHNLSISLSGSREAEIAEIPLIIKDRQELVARLQGDQKELDRKIQDITDEKARLLISQNASEQELDADFGNIKGLFEQKERVRKGWFPKNPKRED